VKQQPIWRVGKNRYGSVIDVDEQSGQGAHQVRLVFLVGLLRPEDAHKRGWHLWLLVEVEHPIVCLPPNIVTRPSRPPDCSSTDSINKRAKPPSTLACSPQVHGVWRQWPNGGTHRSPLREGNAAVVEAAQQRLFTRPYASPTRAAGEMGPRGLLPSAQDTNI
jgi:hypothetical protein